MLGRVIHDFDVKNICFMDKEIGQAKRIVLLMKGVVVLAVWSYVHPHTA